MKKLKYLEKINTRTNKEYKLTKFHLILTKKVLSLMTTSKIFLFQLSNSLIVKVTKYNHLKMNLKSSYQIKMEFIINKVAYYLQIK